MSLPKRGPLAQNFMTLPTAIHRSKQGLATLLSFCLLWTSANFAEAAQPAPVRPVQFELAPPLVLGSVVDSFAATGSAYRSIGVSATQPLVILMQGLIAHYGVQKNITSILYFLAKKLAGTLTRPNAEPPRVYIF